MLLDSSANITKFFLFWSYFINSGRNCCQLKIRKFGELLLFTRKLIIFFYQQIHWKISYEGMKHKLIWYVCKQKLNQILDFNKCLTERACLSSTSSHRSLVISPNINLHYYSSNRDWQKMGPSFLQREMMKAGVMQNY